MEKQDRLKFRREPTQRGLAFTQIIQEGREIKVGLGKKGMDKGARIAFFNVE